MKDRGSARDPRRRFSSRVDDYVRFRPGYPAELVDAVCELLPEPAQATVADVGSGTGIFTRLLLQRGLEVYAVEPNADMRAAAERAFAKEPNFFSIDGSAEATGLAPHSVDLVTAAQAFHWFDADAARREFGRILKPGGKIALIWNRRRLEQPFQAAYETLLREYAPEYGRVNHMNLRAPELAAFFGVKRMQQRHFDYRQRLDFDGLVGRLKSSSYCPAEGGDAFAVLRDALHALYIEHAHDGIVEFEYDSELYCGELEP